MITNTVADMFNIASQNGITNIAAGPINVGGNLSRLNCYQDLVDNKVLVLPFEQFHLHFYFLHIVELHQRYQKS